MGVIPLLEDRESVEDRVAKDSTRWAVDRVGPLLPSESEPS